MENLLDKIIAGKKKEVDLLKKELAKDPSHPIHSILKEGREAKRFFEKALKQPRLSIIAEIKRCSPSAGKIGEIPDASALAALYAEGGASAISVLTDLPNFGGSIKDLIEVKKTTALPLLRKDFIIDPIQIAEAVFAGACAILLIVGATKEKTKELFLEAERLGLDVLVEVNNEEELDAALVLGARIIGVNNRDLKTFQVDQSRALLLKKLIPENIVTVAASGMKTVDDVKKVREAGYDAALIGQMLVESENAVSIIEKIRGDK